MRQEVLFHQQNQSLFHKMTSFSSVRQQEGKKKNLYSETKVPKKGRMFLNIEIGNMPFNVYV